MFKLITLTKFALLIILIVAFCSCSQKPGQTEVVYKNYSMSQLNGYLNGRWTMNSEPKESENKPTLYQFDFVEANRGFFVEMQPMEKETEYSIATHPPFFKITKRGNVFYLTLTYMYRSYPDSLRIQTISNKKLVLANDSITRVYFKKEME